MECPFINKNFAKCSQVLNIQNLEGAYQMCTDNYHRCPIYRKMRMAQAELVSTPLVAACSETSVKKHAYLTLSGAMK